ncbi:MAG: hypothetical protein EBR48_06185 [bacterium]|nr:hypothetical protein [Candidatus Aquidulcis frankliniae]
MSEAKMPERWDIGPYERYMVQSDGGDYVKTKDVEPLVAEIARLRARVAELERDASRYQWLKNRKWMSLQTSYMKWIRKDSTSFIASHDLAADGTQYAPYETLDETIDAAMKEAKP